jgi:predicted MPP superfamily phosphohydrolase
MKYRKVVILIICLIMGVGGYIFVGNQNVTIDKVTMNHRDLPEEFVGYKILQITDLHGKEFGKNQEKLIEKINEVDYEIILFTGDYVNKDNPDLKPLEDLLKGLHKDVEKYFILGNADVDNSVSTLVKGNEYVDLFTKYNVKSLYPGVKLKKEDSSIWLTFSPYVAVNEIAMEKPDEIKSIEVDFKEEFVKESDPFKIEVAHVPTEINYENENIKFYRTNTLKAVDNEWINWDMSISGHTHGGQARLPFIGAVGSPNTGLFPGEINIKGVHYYNGRVQYVSPGLGASGPKFLQFRVFNPPTISLIELSNNPVQQ